MTRFYLDTSVAVHALSGTRSASMWFDSIRAPDDRLVSSRLLRTELARVLRRDDEAVSLRDLILDRVDITPVTESIVTSAESITAHLRTLDAVHLATAMAFGSDTVVATHDASLQRAAASAGLGWIDPVRR